MDTTALRGAIARLLILLGRLELAQWVFETATDDEVTEFAAILRRIIPPKPEK